MSANRHRSAFQPDAGTVVILPSHTLPPGELGHIKGYRLYEERLLFFLLLLRKQAVRVVFVSSCPVHPAIVDYYLRLLPDVADARRRLHMISVERSGITDSRPLTCKVLESRTVRQQIADAAGGDAWLLPFVVTEHEERLADAIGLPLYGPPARLAAVFGTKTGSRQLAALAGVDVVPGEAGLTDISDIQDTARRLAAEFGPLMLKLNDGYGGLGNAIIDHLPKGLPLSRAKIRYSAPRETWDSFAGKMAARGVTVERYVTSLNMRSPSVLVGVTPGGSLEVIATHDQVLAGTIYQGCSFPAGNDYRLRIQECGERVADALAAQGVIGLFSVDFLVSDGATMGANGRQGGEPDVMLCEINLRLGGTTHPFGTALLATDGTYDRYTGNLLAGGRAKHYVSTDNLLALKLRGRSPADVVARLGDWAFDPGSGTGAILHMLSAAVEYGKVGITAIGDSPEGAERIYRGTSQVLSA